MNLMLVNLMNFVLVIFIVLLLHKGKHRYSNIMLSIYFISQVIGISEEYIYNSYPEGHGIPFILYPVIFTWGPLFFFYICALLDHEFILKQYHVVHFIPFMVVFGYTCYAFYTKNLATRLELTNEYKLQLDLASKFSLVFNLQIIGYNIWSVINYKRYQQRLKQEYSTINKAANNWLKTSLFGFLVACLIVQIAMHSQNFGFLKSLNWYIIGNIAFLLFFIILFYKAIISPDILLSSSIKEKYKFSTLDKTDAQKILSTLEHVMNNQRPYTNPDLTLKALSGLSKIPERTLSQVINKYRKQNFFDFINSYRVNYTMELLKDNQNHRRTMLDILFEAGFNSKSTFNSAFKKLTGNTPSEYKNRYA